MTQHLFMTLDFPPQRGGVARYYHALIAAAPVLIQVIHEGLISRFFVPHWLPAFFRLFFLLVFRRFSWVHVGNLLPLGTVAYLLSFLFPFRYVVFCHGLDLQYAKQRPRKFLLAQRILRRANLVVVNSEFTKSLLKEFNVHSEAVLVLTPGCTVFKSHVAENAASTPILLTVCRLVPRKGIDRMLHVLPVLRRRFPSVRYVIIGTGPDEARLRQLAQSKGVSDCVLFLGACSDDELLAWYARCTAFVLLAESRQGGADVEGFGIVFLEANACGKPVIAGNSGGVSEAVLDGETGLLVDPSDASAVIGACMRLLADPELCRRLGEAGRRRVERDFRWKNKARQLFDELEKRR